MTGSRRKDIGANVKFGLVAFRSRTKDKSELEYLSKVFVDPNDAIGKDDFLASVKSLAPASASTARFSEDAFAGMVTALNDIDWQTFGGRYIVLITDAGALEGNDEYSSTGMDSDQMRLLAQERGTAIYTIHLLTPEGKGNHKDAEAQYSVLSQNAETSQPLLYPVEGGDVGQFGKVISLSLRCDRRSSEDRQCRRPAPGRRSATAAGQRRQPTTRRASSPMSRRSAMRCSSPISGASPRRRQPGVRRRLGRRPRFREPTVATDGCPRPLTKRQLSDLQQVLRTVLDVGKTKQFKPGGLLRGDPLRRRHRQPRPSQAQGPERGAAR